MSLSYALLGFLNYIPMTGYDIKKMLDDSTNFFWPAKTSQIYRELKALEKQGYIVSAVTPSDKGPDKRVYRITESGESHLKDWLIEGNTSESMRNSFMVWILFSSKLSLEELYLQMQKKLKEYKKEQQMLKAIDGKIQEFSKMFRTETDAFNWRIVLKRGFYDVEAKIRWAEDTIELIKDQRKLSEK